MSKKLKLATTTSLVLAALISLSACSGSSDDPYVLPAATGAASVPADSIPAAPIEGSAAAPTEAVQAAGTGTPTSLSPSPATSQPPALPAREEITVDLTPESGTLYVAARSGFDPMLEAWVADQVGGQLEYRRFTCVGTTDAVGAGVLAPYKGGQWQVTWAGDNPLQYATGPDERLTITDQTLTLTLSLGGDVASSRTDIALESFTGMCRKAETGTAEFVTG